jgi:hypothetical protein
VQQTVVRMVRISMHLIPSRSRINSEDPRRRLAQLVLDLLKVKSTSVSAAKRDAHLAHSSSAHASLGQVSGSHRPVRLIAPALDAGGNGAMGAMEKWRNGRVQIFRRSQPPRLSCDLQMRRGHAEEAYQAWDEGYHSRIASAILNPYPHTAAETSLSAVALLG